MSQLDNTVHPLGVRLFLLEALDTHTGTPRLFNNCSRWLLFS